MFNDSQYPRMIAEGLLKSEYLWNGHLQNPEDWQGPWCTHSQTIRYLDNQGQWLVEVHQYLRPDGTLGASGIPDPKRLRIGDTVYALERHP